MKNKGPAIISCLSQIILLILLIQLTGLVKLFALGAIFISVALVLIALFFEKHWKNDGWFVFYTNLVVLIAVMINSSQYQAISPIIIILLIVVLMTEFFIVSFSDIPKQKEEEKKKEKTEPQLEIIDLKEPIIKRKKEKIIKVNPLEIFIKNKENYEGELVTLKESNKYHQADCGYVKKARKNRKEFFSTKKQAEAKGLKPCKLCIKK